MSNITRFVSLVALTLVFLVVVVLGICRHAMMAAPNDVPPGDGVQAANPLAPKLRVQLRTPKTHLLLGEPVFVSLAIYNAGQDNATAVRCNPPGSDYLNYEITAPGQPSRTYQGGVILSGRGAPSTLLLRPSDAFSRDDDLTLDRTSTGLLIDRPGEYVIHAGYSLPDGVAGGPLSLRSNGVCLIGEEPSGLDKEVHDALIERVAQKTKGRIWSINHGVIEDYEAIAAQYPQSTYTVYIYYYLAQAYEFYGKVTMSGTTATIPLLQKAITNYQLVAELSKDTPLGIEARQLAGRCYATLGQTAEAEIAFRDVFCSGATTEMQIKMLAWIEHLESGMFYEESGLAQPGEMMARNVMLPLLPYARALGYELRQDTGTGESVVTNGDYHWVIQPGDRHDTICGILYEDLRVEMDTAGDFRVSPAVIVMLMEERFCHRHAQGSTVR